MLPESLANIQQAIDESISLIERRLAVHLEQLDHLMVELERARGEAQRQLEERSLEQSLSGQHGTQASKVTGELRAQEDQLTNDYSRTSALYRQLNDFVHLLMASRQQFQLEVELPGVEDAHRLTVRQAMIRAQEAERRRLAREIHDGPAQVLANAIIGLEFIERSLRGAEAANVDQSIGEIQRVKVAMREGLTEIRRFIFDLRPTMLSQRGLAATIEHYIEAYRRLFSGEFAVSLPARLPRLSADQEMTAFRVIQESLQNAHRHAHATKIWVTLSVEDDKLIVQVRDNGEGFRPSAVTSSATSGFGLAGMRERAEVIGGRLSVESAPGQGTDVTLVMPLANHSLDSVHDSGLNRNPHLEGAARESGASPNS